MALEPSSGAKRPPEFQGRRLPSIDALVQKLTTIGVGYYEHQKAKRAAGEGPAYSFQDGIKFRHVIFLGFDPHFPASEPSQIVLISLRLVFEQRSQISEQREEDIRNR
ncbi:hypothetical protein NliqN6_2086 [Naganishia liquefaciens]|uniref:Uncharacterized protein n=1 Tax=Naganishia liquefaciens TaxID=104408 RepID=A0A8H3TSZ6_9TREE|nr:hypothetical protein NliqN6_2086 [Naganishia liquefaciens]